MPDDDDAAAAACAAADNDDDDEDDEPPRYGYRNGWNERSVCKFRVVLVVVVVVVVPSTIITLCMIFIFVVQNCCWSMYRFLFLFSLVWFHDRVSSACTMFFRLYTTTVGSLVVLVNSPGRRFGVVVPLDQLESSNPE
jgi:energy-coupling factor transporter transmembrane protein EcfT